MKVTIVQLDIKYKDIDHNLKNFKNMIEKIDEVGDLIVLPEMFTTGYIFNTKNELYNISENIQSSSVISELKKVAAHHNATIVAGIPEKVNSKLYNSAVIVNANGIIDIHRKIALTNIDKDFFERGDKATTLQLKGINIGVCICFDTWFPEITRQYLKNSTDIIIHIANFGGEQSFDIIKSRAIENNCYIVTCNRIGTEYARNIDATYCGKSQVTSPTGEIILKLDKNEKAVTTDIPIVKSTIKKNVLGVDLKTEINEINNQF